MAVVKAQATISLALVNDGATGAAGKDGVGIKSTTVTYAAGTNGTTAPTGTYSTTVPSVAAGGYLWTKTVLAYTNGTTVTSYSVGHIGKDGATGKDGVAGKAGVGITTTAITYASSTSGTTAPTGGFSATIPAVSAGSYLWTKTVWTYSDGTNETGYSVALMGKTGATGKQGATGATGPAGPPGPAGKDITSFRKGTSVPTTVAAAGSMYWLLDSTGACSTVYISDGSKWNATQVSASLIRAASFQGMSFEGVTFTGSKFISPYSFDGSAYGFEGGKWVGTATLGDGALDLEGTIDGTQKTSAIFNGSGMYNMIYADKTDKTIIAGIGLTKGQMMLWDTQTNTWNTLEATTLQRLNNTGNMLWSGAWKMAAATTLTVNKNINECLNGWALLWSGGDTNAPSNFNYTTTFISKGFAARHSGAGVHMDLGGTKTSDAAFKYCYFTPTTIKGNDANATGTSNNYVLREVYEW